MWRTKQKSDEDQPLEPAQCPVCKMNFSGRNPENIFIAHCEECKATFTWLPRTTKPTVILDRDVRKSQRYCSRDGCHCHS